MLVKLKDKRTSISTGGWPLCKLRFADDIVESTAVTAGTYKEI